MRDPRVSRLVMPKWGLTMTRGRVVKWLVPEGAKVAAGDELVDVETEKIASAVEAPAAGVLRRFDPTANAAFRYLQPPIEVQIEKRLADNVRQAIIRLRDVER